MNGQQTAPAEMVRSVQERVSIAELINEAKARTWTHEVEHAVVRLASGERVMVRGGRDGIEFLVEGEGEQRTLHMLIEGRKVQVVRIYGHSHPRVTGPSDGDLEALAILKQKHSYLIEYGVHPRGTRIEPKSGRQPNVG
jgi:hypothetical protein